MCGAALFSCLVLIAHEMQRAGLAAFELSPTGKGVVAAVGDPEFFGVHVGDCLGEFVPVGVV